MKRGCLTTSFEMKKEILETIYSALLVRGEHIWTNIQEYKEYYNPKHKSSRKVMLMYKKNLRKTILAIREIEKLKLKEELPSPRNQTERIKMKLPPY